MNIQPSTARIRSDSLFLDFTTLADDPGTPVPQIAIGPCDIEEYEGGLNASVFVAEGTALTVFFWTVAGRPCTFHLRAGSLGIEREGLTDKWRLDLGRLWNGSLSPTVPLTTMDGALDHAVVGSVVRVRLRPGVQHYWFYRRGRADSTFLALSTGFTEPDLPLQVMAPAWGEARWAWDGNSTAECAFHVLTGPGLSDQAVLAPLIAPHRLSVAPGEKCIVKLGQTLSPSGMVVHPAAPATVATLVEFFESKVVAPQPLYSIGVAGDALITWSASAARKSGQSKKLPADSDEITVLYGETFTDVVQLTKPITLAEAFVLPLLATLPSSSKPKQWPIAILKASTATPLRSLFAAGGGLHKLRVEHAEFWDSIKDIIGAEQPGSLPDDWTGVMLFGPSLAVTEEQLSKLFPPDGPGSGGHPLVPFQLLALSGCVTGSGPQDVKPSDVTLSAARVTYRNTEQPPEEQQQDKPSFRLQSLTLTCLNGRLTQADVDGDLNLARMFGISQKGLKEVGLKGSYDVDTGRLGLRADSEGGLLVLESDSDEALFRTCVVTGIRFLFEQDSQEMPLTVSLAGSLTLGQLVDFGSLSGKKFTFSELRLVGEGAQKSRPSMLKPDYASARIERVAAESDDDEDSFQASVTGLRQFENTSAAEILRAEGLVELGNPPGAASLDQVIMLQSQIRWIPPASWMATAASMDLRVGLCFYRDGEDMGAFAGVGAGDVALPSLKLGSILDIGFDSVDIDNYEWPTPGNAKTYRYSYFACTNMRLSFLGTELLDDLSLLLYALPANASPYGGALFASLGTPSARASKELKVNWLVGGFNVFKGGWEEALDAVANVEAPWAEHEKTIKKKVEAIFASPTTNYFVAPPGGLPVLSGWLLGADVQLYGLKASSSLSTGWVGRCASQKVS